MRAVPVSELEPGIRLTTEEKPRENLSQGSRTVFTMLDTIRLGDVVVILLAASIGLLTSVTLSLHFR